MLGVEKASPQSGSGAKELDKRQWQLVAVVGGVRRGGFPLGRTKECASALCSPGTASAELKMVVSATQQRKQ